MQNSMVVLTFSILDWHRHIQRDLEASIPVWAPKLGAQKSFLVQHILHSIVISNLQNTQLKFPSNSNLGKIFEKNTLN